MLKILKEEDALAIFIPKGFLHGYVSLKRKTIIVNYSSSAYNQKKEVGVNVNSLPIKLPKIKLIYSKKDKELPSYKNLINK